MERARPVDQSQGPEAKKSYGGGPTLVVYGSIAKLTQGASGSGPETGVTHMTLPTPCL